MLISNHLLFLLEVRDNLSQGFFQYLDLVLVRFDLILLHIGPLLILLLSTRIDSYVSLDLSVNIFLLLYLFLVFLEFVSLRDCLQSETLIFLMDLTLDCLNSYV